MSKPKVKPRIPLKPPPTRGTIIAASWLALFAYALALALAFIGYSNAKEFADSWSGACGSSPTITNYSIQYAIAGIVVSTLGFLISLTHTPKYIRVMGGIVIVCCLLAAAASSFTASFHLCF